MRTGAASRRSTAVPPARNAPTRSDAAEAGTLPRAPLTSVAATVMAAGGVTDGANVSTTITLNDAVRVLPCASLAVQVTVVAPSANVDPLAGAQLGVTGPSSVSAAASPAPVAHVGDTDDNGPSLSVNGRRCEPIGNIAVTVAAFPISVARSVHRKDRVSPSRSVPLPASVTLVPAADVASTVCGV